MADGNPAMLKGFQSNEVFLAPWVYTTTTIFRNRELSNDLAVMRHQSGMARIPPFPDHVRRLAHAPAGQRHDALHGL